MPRDANAVDFWRGFALIEIFVNHVPGNFYEQFTHKALSLSDSAELFVFLAGWSLKFVVGPPDAPAPAVRLVGRLVLRAYQLFSAHVVIVMLAVAMLAAAARLLDNPLILEWFNAAAVFYEPVETHIGLVLLTHQLGYFDILPLYVVLLLLSPLIALLDRFNQTVLLTVSFLIYIVSLITEATFTTWPTQGEWFFNPMCWQFDFVLGFLFARPTGAGGWARRNLGWVRIVAIPILAAAAWARWYGFELDPTLAPEPHLLFVDAKSFLSPIRVMQFLLLVAAFSAVYPTIARFVPPLVSVLSLLGRNSLLVFCLGSLLSLALQIGRFAVRGGIAFDTAAVAGGLLLLYAVAAGHEWLETSR
ncbi:OpgC family protein [Siculibacillus lacustris]|uniref:OpgC family protein n=1 Tax=Siculibacillus lacustris TaxID=1549641 RepID=UPI0013F1456B|nr:OpgC domain-containing protein [Siculibacillus lacustris]